MPAMNLGHLKKSYQGAPCTVFNSYFPFEIHSHNVQTHRPMWDQTALIVANYKSVPSRANRPQINHIHWLFIELLYSNC